MWARPKARILPEKGGGQAQASVKKSSCICSVGQVLVDGEGGILLIRICADSYFIVGKKIIPAS